MRNPHTSFAASRRLPNNRDIAIYLLGRTHKPAFCKRGSVRFAPKATEMLHCREASLCATGRHMQCSKNLAIRAARAPPALLAVVCRISPRLMIALRFLRIVEYHFCELGLADV